MSTVYAHCIRGPSEKFIESFFSEIAWHRSNGVWRIHMGIQDVLNFYKSNPDAFFCLVSEAEKHSLEDLPAILWGTLVRFPVTATHINLKNYDYICLQNTILPNTGFKEYVDNCKDLRFKYHRVGSSSLKKGFFSWAKLHTNILSPRSSWPEIDFLDSSSESFESPPAPPPATPEETHSFDEFIRDIS